MAEVLRIRDLPTECVARLLAPLGLRLEMVAIAAPIPHSFWGESEAGIGTEQIWARADTPLHSLLHETSHWLCATRLGRKPAAGDAGSDDAEECAVCYLQVLLAGGLPPPVSRARLFADMDRWGYSFREGSAARWFEGDGEDAREWLVVHGIVNDCGALLISSGGGQSLVGFGASP